MPEPFRTLPGLDLLVPDDQAVADPDLVICFDVAAGSRLGGLIDRLERAPASVVLDHHASNTWFGAGPTWSIRRAAATSVVAVQLLDRLGVTLDAEIAECLYVALATDTGSFKFDMTTPEVHELAARLIATGIRPGDIARQVFDTRPFGAIKLYGEVLGRARLEPAAAGGVGLVWTYATQEDLRRHDQQPYVLEEPDRLRPPRRGGGCVLRGQAGRRRRVGGLPAQQGRGGREPGRGRAGRRRAPAGRGLHRARLGGRGDGPDPGRASTPEHLAELGLCAATAG